MVRNLAYLVFAGVAVGAAIVHGHWTERWRPAPAVDEAVARLARLPRNVGDWQATDIPLTQEELKAAKIAGYVQRRYENVRNRQAVSVILVCGRPGPIAVHTPDICFAGAGYRALTTPGDFALEYGTPTREASFKTMRMQRENAAFPTELRIFWAWGAEGRWQAPANPRLSFARQSALYKLYVFREKPADDAIRPEDDPCVLLLRQLLPEMDLALFAER